MEVDHPEQGPGEIAGDGGLAGGDAGRDGQSRGRDPLMAAPPSASRGRPVGRGRSCTADATTTPDRDSSGQPPGRADSGGQRPPLPLQRGRRADRTRPPADAREDRRDAAEPLHPLRFEPILKAADLGRPAAGDRAGQAARRARPTTPRAGRSPTIATTSAGRRRAARGDVAARPGPDAGPGTARARPSRTRDQFPLLVKFLDAHQVLSVQVHPDDEQGRRLADDNGKTEAWVIVHAEPGSLIYAGLSPGVTRERVRRGDADGHASSRSCTGSSRGRATAS